jgi:YihY family inner membrane protein
MSVRNRITDRLDRLQSSWAPLAFGYGVAKRYGEDQGATLAALITFYALLAVFPLLLLFVTVVGVVVDSDPHLRQRIIDSALSEFPVVGDHLSRNIHGLSTANPVATAVTALVLLWGALGVTRSLQRASVTVWEGEPVVRIGLVARLRGLLLLGVMAGAVVLSSILTGFSLAVSAAGFEHLADVVVTLLGAAVVNMGAYLVALRVLAPAGTPWRALLWGTVVGGIGWTLLQGVGGLLIEHQLRRSTELYGFFGIVLGLVLWLNIGSQLFVVASEVNVVRHRQLWPRHLHEPDSASAGPPSSGGGGGP